MERHVNSFTQLSYDTPQWLAAAYYPETNQLVPLDNVGDKTFKPVSELIAIQLKASLEKDVT